MHDNVYLQYSGLDLPDNFELSQEGIKTSLSNFLESMSESLSLMYRKLMNEEARLDDTNFVPRASVESVLESQGWSYLRKLRCFTPAKMNGQMVEHLEVLNEQVKMLVDIEKRLLDPLIKYTAEVIASPGTLEKTWVDKDLSLLDTDRMKKSLVKTFDPEKMVGDTPYESRYGEVYSSKRDIYASADMLKDLLENARYLDLKILSEKDEKLAKYIDEVANIVEDVEADKNTVVKLANAVSSASVELEYISAVFYYINVNINAFYESFEYTKRVIEA